MEVNEEFYKTLIENSQELICFHEPNGKFLFLSPSIQKIAGYKPEELTGKNPYDYFHPSDRDHIQNDGHNPILRGSEKSLTEYRFLTKSGKYIWLQTLTTPILNKSNQIENLLSSSREISNLVYLKEELLSKEILLEQAGLLSEVGAWELDAKTLNLIHSNAWYAILEVDKDQEMTLRESFELFPEQAKEKIKATVEDALKNGREWDMILPINTMRGNKLWIRSVGKVKLKYGDVDKVFGIIQNVTNQVETQNNLKAMVNKLTKQKDHLEGFNHIISHNLRSPVKNLNLLISHLEGLNQDEECQVFIDHIKKVSDSINEQLDDLVDVVRLIRDKDIEIEEVKLREVITKTKSILNGQIHQLDPEIKIDLSEWSTIKWNKMYMESVILNLLSNALKYSSPERRPEIHLKTFVEDDKKGFYMEDNGLGIDLKKYGDKVFKLNRTFHKNINGKGMGLFMTKKQIESMGGSITLESEENIGTKFTVLLENGL